MADTVHIDLPASASIEYKDSKGDIITTPNITTPAVWASSNPAVATINADGSGLTLVADGVTTLSVSFGVDGNPFNLTDELTVIDGAVASARIVITVGTAQKKAA